MKERPFRSLAGFDDVPPDACLRRNRIFDAWRACARRFAFREYDAPEIEDLRLYTEKSGAEIVDQLFAFETKGGEAVTLRPEMTPSIARIVGAQANALKKPVKWFNIGPFYRYERPQRGRKRSFHQFNADIFGEAGPGADAEIIALAVASLRELGLTRNDFVVRISDRQLWALYLAGLGFEGERAEAVLGAIDHLSKIPEEKKDAAIALLQPHFGDAAEDFLGRFRTLGEIRDLGQLGEFLEAHVPSAALQEAIGERLAAWRDLLDRLELLGVSDCTRIDLGVVRGLAYYTGFVFEIFDTVGDLRALCGGGRYDDLMGRLGFPEMPSVGFGMGAVTLQILLEEKGLLPETGAAIDGFAVIGGDGQRAAAVRTVAELRAAGYSVGYPLKPVGFRKQFQQANDAGARVALIFGEEEVAAGIVKLREMDSGEERDLPIDTVVEAFSELCEAGGRGQG